MDESTRGTLEFVAVQLTAVFAGLHFYWAFPRLVQTVQFGQPLYRDPRPLLFIGLTVVVLAGLALVQQGVVPRTAAYVAGMALMAVSVVAWMIWHLGGHVALLPWAPEGVGQTHVGNPVAVLFEHAIGDPIEGVSKAVEVALFGVLGVLLYDEVTGEPAAETEPSADADQ
ncbi:hypothetical protein SAMN06269185_3065 [Natronoarchaeum philippinense]|uniref:Uncharacterized protein n=1 Tax=Natronoarchaeum philippinense TaxID=558529 RepID=A0A285P7C8_NATPI|nr:hypothetical protein [Natronoarchaeum philippinense]SNZ17634.1 hypothetical protein SAMN06269185_3065 [Natronoarchaeum philippinense]